MIKIEEVWKEVKGSNGKYKVSSFGRVWNNIKDKEYNYQINQYGYHNCSVIYLGKRVNIGVHRLVALHFIPNPDNKPTVNHKVADKSINHVGNLEWATYKEQMEHVSINKLHPKTQKCCIVDSNDNIETIYQSLNELHRILNVSTGFITNSCYGKLNTIKGLKVRFYDDVLDCYTKTRFDLDKTIISKGIYKKKIYCELNGKTYNKQQDCADDLGIKQIRVSKMLIGAIDNTYKLKYLS